MLAPNQIRAARALLGWSGPALAAAAGVSLSTVRRIEEGSQGSILARNAIARAFELQGVTFMGGGVRLEAKASA